MKKVAHDEDNEDVKVNYSIYSGKFEKNSEDRNPLRVRRCVLPLIAVIL